MDFAKKLFSIFSPQPLKTSGAAESSDLRAHIRIRPAFDNVVFLESTTLHQVKLIDISYGGAAILTSTQINDDAPISFKLRAVDRFVELTAKPVHRRGQQLGLSFIHDKPDGLIFLRDIIENMKSTASTTKIPHEMTKLELQHLGAQVWRDDGPVDILFFPQGSGAKSGTPASLTVCFRDGKDYYQVNISKGKIITSKSDQDIDAPPHQASNLMKTAHSIDLDALRKTLYLFCGATDPELKKAFAPFAAEVLAQFNQNLRIVK